jgi:hypothetical protein
MLRLRLLVVPLLVTRTAANNAAFDISFIAQSIARSVDASCSYY